MLAFVSTLFFTDTPATALYTLSLHDALPIFASTTPATFPDSPGRLVACGPGRCRLGRGRAEGVEEFVAEGVHGLERGAEIRHQPVLPVPGGHLPEYRRGAGDDRDRHVVGGPVGGGGGGGLMVAHEDGHGGRVVQLGDP